MRQLFQEQLPLCGPAVPHAHGRELEAMDRVLKENPRIAEHVLQALEGELEYPERGRPGMTAAQVLRATVVKQMNGFSYETLHFHLLDSISYRWFCGFGSLEQVPSKSALAHNIKRLSGERWERINRILMKVAEARGVEDGRKVRIDPTVTESHIHHPTDNALLWDSVRVLTRLLRQADEHVEILYSDHTRRAKRRHFNIRNARNRQQREKPYRDLLKVTRKVAGYARRAIGILKAVEGERSGQARALADKLAHYLGLTERVISQTERRVLQGESVPAAEKVLSIFEPHVDVIRKDNRDTYYGHKVTLTGGASGLILDWVVEEGNPADSTLMARMLERQESLYGRVPEQAAMDGGFASRENLRQAKEMGVEDVAFAKKRGIEVLDMVRSTWVYQRLRNFRAGIEGIISFLKRIFGLGRCTWRGSASFHSYVGASIFSANLLLLARHLIE
ncbi:MAG: ISNCY family transposase [Candidatus Longimicrobiales bacterium M2_2A_002]